MGFDVEEDMEEHLLDPERLWLVGLAAAAVVGGIDTCVAFVWRWWALGRWRMGVRPPSVLPLWGTGFGLCLVASAGFLLWTSRLPLLPLDGRQWTMATAAFVVGGVIGILGVGVGQWIAELLRLSLLRSES